MHGNGLKYPKHKIGGGGNMILAGYQLCYSMGMHEILSFRKRFSSRLTLKTFHDTLFEGGKLPLYLFEIRDSRED